MLLWKCENNFLDGKFLYISIKNVGVELGIYILMIFIYIFIFYLKFKNLMLF